MVFITADSFSSSEMLLDFSFKRISSSVRTFSFSRISIRLEAMPVSSVENSDFLMESPSLSRSISTFSASNVFVKRIKSLRAILRSSPLNSSSSLLYRSAFLASLSRLLIWRLTSTIISLIRWRFSLDELSFERASALLTLYFMTPATSSIRNRRSRGFEFNISAILPWSRIE